VTFRRRIMVAMLPLFALLVVLGGTGTILIYHLGNQIDTILHENYRSVVYMRDLNEALERIDSSFQFALAGREKESKDDYLSRWERYKASLHDEEQNITVPGEGELVGRLRKLSDRYRQQGGKFFGQTGQPRKDLYFGTKEEPGLYAIFREIKDVSGAILRINEKTLLDAKQQAQDIARSSLVWYGSGLAIGIA
jgi:NtrC-family two-component system sensor histidine kinase KinB